MRTGTRLAPGAAAVFAAAAAALVAVVPTDTSADKGRDAEYRRAEMLAEARAWMLSNHVDPVDGRRLFHGALLGMAESLDEHSTFLSPEETAALSEEAGGAFGGVGILVIRKGSSLEIAGVIQGGPAARAGLKKGDAIVSIGGGQVKSLHPDRALARLRGEPGSEVEIGVERPGAGPLIFRVKRDLVASRSVGAHGMLEGAEGVGYARLDVFQRTTGNELKLALAELLDAGMKALVLDLRGNPGGSIDAAVEAADLFLESGPILSTAGRSENSVSDIAASAGGPCEKQPLAVLVDSATASAAEALAASLQRRERTVIAGSRTYGKNTVQSILKLEDGSALKITTARFLIPGSTAFGPGGSRFEGIEPAMKLEEAASGAPLPGTIPRDAAVAAAAAKLRGMVK